MISKQNLMPELTCRKCYAVNPMVYFAPAAVNAKGTCICFACAKSKNWLDRDDNLKEGVEL